MRKSKLAVSLGGCAAGSDRGGGCGFGPGCLSATRRRGRVGCGAGRAPAAAVMDGRQAGWCEDRLVVDGRVSGSICGQVAGGFLRRGTRPPFRDVSDDGDCDNTAGVLNGRRLAAATRGPGGTARCRRNEAFLHGRVDSVTPAVPHSG